MCGIAGYIGLDIAGVPPEVDSRLCSAMHYRGRDAEGDWGDNRQVKLFHARLSVIDLVSGDQPMWDWQKRFVIVFNGEIYNYRELRDEYEKKGARFLTQSDTEVILEGYKLKGPEVCKDLNGMFAMAIWDTQKQELFLARDHLGKKPLVWCNLGGRFYFSSTLDSFSAIPGWSGEISRRGLLLYLQLSGFPRDETIYHQAYQLPPACWALIRPGEQEPRIQRYWHLNFEHKSRRGLSSLLAEYGELLKDSIALRLRSDVPVGLTFSGGVDSGTIAAILANEMQVPLRCFTLDYHTEQDPSEETVVAKQVVEHLGLPWTYIQFDYHSDLLPQLPMAYSHYDQPCQQLPLVYAHKLYEHIKPYATVILCGNGADEIFTGYVGDEGFRKRDLRRQTLGRLPQRLLNRLGASDASQAVLKTYEGAVAFHMAKLTSDDDTYAAALEVVSRNVADMATCQVDSFMDMSMWVALMFSTSDSNYRLPDISGLAAQVEVRSPFLDYHMVEFAARLPHRYKVNRAFSNPSTKYLPKKYYEKLVPRDLAWSPKKGMAYNVRWDKSVAVDQVYKDAFVKAYEAVEARGIEAGPMYTAWREYIAAKENGVEFPDSSNHMMNGFMLGSWFLRQPPGEDQATS